MVLTVVLIATILVAAARGDESKMDACEIIESRGFACVVHHVTSRDGYILTLHRIVDMERPLTKSIILNHGVLGSSIDFLINDNTGNKSEPLEVDGKETVGNNLGFELAKRG